MTARLATVMAATEMSTGISQARMSFRSKVIGHDSADNKISCVICARSYHFVIAVWRAKAAESGSVNYWEIIADNLSKAGWSWGCVSAIDSNGRTIWIVDAHRGNGKRFVVRADEKLTAKLLLSVSGAVLVFTARATAVTFTDTTFNLANYSESIGTTSGATVSFAQCPSCGHPGQALQILVTFATTADAAGVGFVNNTFSYNPSVVPIASINASVDKNVSSNIPFNPSTTIPTAFWPLIEQDGLFYIAPVSGPTYHGGTTGYLHHSQSGLVATDFTQFNFTTGTFGTAHPDFAGDLMLFGLAQLAGAAINNENAEIDYDNLKLSIAVPEGGDTALLLLCSLAALLLVSRMCQCHQAS